MRALIAMGALLLVLAPGCARADAGKDITIRLRITVWPYGQEPGKPSYVWTLRCNPLGGTLPFGDRACYRLAVDPEPFAAVPRDAACTQIYAGPAIAFVRGTRRGRTVRAFLRRSDGCELQRWERVGFLFPKYV